MARSLQKEGHNIKNSIKTIHTDDGKILFVDNNNNSNRKSKAEQRLEMESYLQPNGPLRRSLFGGVPPFINWVPGGGFTGKTEKGPQYWDSDQVMVH